MSAPGKILVIEDNDFVRMQIVKFLGEIDAEIVETTDGTSGLEAMDSSIDLVIADVRMEPMDGFEFIRSIRGADNDTPVILVTGDHNPDLLSEASKWGVVAVLMKPVDRERLLKTVDRTLQAKRRAS